MTIPFVIDNQPTTEPVRWRISSAICRPNRLGEPFRTTYGSYCNSDSLISVANAVGPSGYSPGGGRPGRLPGAASGPEDIARSGRRGHTRRRPPFHQERGWGQGHYRPDGLVRAPVD